MIYEKIIKVLELIALGESVTEKDLPKIPWESFDINKLYSKSQLRRAREYVHDIEKLRKQIVEPNMKHINAVTNQENDSKFMTYALIHALKG